MNDIFSMLSLVQAGVGFTLMPGRMKKMYENTVQLLKLSESYQMQQLIAIVFARNRERESKPAGAGRRRADVRTQPPDR
ncbi:Uncharacterised protein [Salmonella enterica subsp. arizonae]|nr:Uncharacterised protein [Salmonella enterica subsp. arizonae]